MKYSEMTDDQAKVAVDGCLRQVVGECMPKRTEADGIKIEGIRITLRSKIGMTENDIALFIRPTPVFDRLPEGDFHIRVVVLAPSGNILQWEIRSSEFAVT